MLPRFRFCFVLLIGMVTSNLWGFNTSIFQWCMICIIERKNNCYVSWMNQVLNTISKFVGEWTTGCLSCSASLMLLILNFGTVVLLFSFFCLFMKGGIISWRVIIVVVGACVGGLFFPLINLELNFFKNSLSQSVHVELLVKYFIHIGFLCSAKYLQIF